MNKQQQYKKEQVTQNLPNKLLFPAFGGKVTGNVKLDNFMENLDAIAFFFLGTFLVLAHFIHHPRIALGLHVVGVLTGILTIYLNVMKRNWPVAYLLVAVTVINADALRVMFT